MDDSPAPPPAPPAATPVPLRPFVTAYVRREIRTARRAMGRDKWDLYESFKTGLCRLLPELPSNASAADREAATIEYERAHRLYVKGARL